ncbi:MAG TPA: mannonate dehydratase, partial [Ureibacillus sp.]|nr:mannonate dehydratase [Ureibacillus sp.]
MRMTFRWFGEGNDPVPLHHIKQIPGTEGIVWALHDIPAGKEWPLDRIMGVKAQIEQAGFHIEVVESVNVHEDIKLGLPSREQYIENYKKTIVSLASAGVKVICYNFMPVFDWLRTNLFGELEDGSTAMFFEKALVSSLTPHDLVSYFQGNTDFQLPGWEPERLAQLSSTLKAYESVDEEQLWNNLQYFLEQIIPVAAEHGIRMAIHPDDPPYPLFGLPRIINNQDSLRRLVKLV